MTRPIGRWTTAIIGASLFLATLPMGSVAVATTLQPGDYIVDTEAPTCPLGGPIYRITPGGDISVIAQGGLLKKPRGNAVLDDNTLLVADGIAGLLKVNLTTGSITRIAEGPP